jgi:hypothetical protein
MDGIHDMGGRHGFGPVVIEKDEPVFHAPWEGKVRAMMGRTLRRYYNLDEFRHAIERMPPDAYLRASYYEKWLHAVETLLLEKGVITAAELSAARAAGPAPPPSMAAEPVPPLVARFKPGDRVVTRNLHSQGHTRLPRYARGKRGAIRSVNGPFLLPDTNAHGLSSDWEACYAVEFSAGELWGGEASANDRICIDLWESYLKPEAAT